MVIMLPPAPPLVHISSSQLVASVLTETADVIDTADADPSERALSWTLRETPVVLEVSYEEVLNRKKPFP